MSLRKMVNFIAVKTVTGEDEDFLMLITAAGVLIRMEVEGISKTGRNTRVLSLIRLESADNEYVSTVAIVGRGRRRRKRHGNRGGNNSRSGF